MDVIMCNSVDPRLGASPAGSASKGLEQQQPQDSDDRIFIIASGGEAV
jgi:hypothetical protein